MSVHKIIIVGDKGVGKKSFKNQILSCDGQPLTPQQQQQQESAIDDPFKMATNRFLTKKIGDNLLKIEFKIVEPDEYAAVRDSFYRSASGFIIMFGIDDPETFKTIQMMREQIFQVRSQSRIILVGNKRDLPKSQRKISKKDAKKLAKKWKAEYLEISVRQNENLEECLNIMLKSIIENKHTRMIKSRSSLKNTLDRFKYYNCLQ